MLLDRGYLTYLATFPAKNVQGVLHRVGDEGLGEEARRSEVQRYYRVVVELLEVPGVDVDGAEVEVFGGEVDAHWVVVAFDHGS